MHPAVIHSTKWKHTPVKCCNNTSRLINQAQMRKKFPQGFGKTNNIISRLLSHNKITPTNNQTFGLQTVPNSTLGSNLADESWHLSFSTGSASWTYAINVSSVSGLSASAAEPVLFAGAFRERWLFPDTMIASLVASPIIVILQQDCVLRFLIKIREGGCNPVNLTNIMPVNQAS